jgi:hypothetical protein
MVRFMELNSGYVMVGEGEGRSVGNQTGEKITTLALIPDRSLSIYWPRRKVNRLASCSDTQELTVSEVAMLAMFFLHMPRLLGENKTESPGPSLVGNETFSSEELIRRIEGLQKLIEDVEVKMQIDRINSIAAFMLCSTVMMGVTGDGAGAVLPVVMVGFAVFIGRQQPQGTLLRGFSDTIRGQAVKFIAQ